MKSAKPIISAISRGRILIMAAIAILAIAVASCRHDNAAGFRLDAAESLMDSRPDSALIMLDSIDVSNLDGKRQRARFALLKSMALDKNYIDTTTFDVLQPAIDFYLEKGTPDERLKTYYYQGRIFQNANEPHKALAAFMRGLDNMAACSDSMAIARAFAAQGAEYMELYDFDNYTQSYLNAAKILKALHHEDFEFRCLISALNGMILMKEREKADSVLSLCREFKSLDDEQRRQLQCLNIAYIIRFGTIEELKDFVASNHDYDGYDTSGIINLASAYNKVGNTTTARQILDRLDTNIVEYDTLKYLSISFQIYENESDFENALATYKQFSSILESTDLRKFQLQIATIEEKHLLEIRAREDAETKSKIIWGCVAGLVTLAMTIVILMLAVRNIRINRKLATEKARNARLEIDRMRSESERFLLEFRKLEADRENSLKEAESLVERIAILESEKATLQNLINTSSEIPDDVKAAIGTRLEMLNNLLAAHITNNSDYEHRYQSRLQELTENSEKFMDTNRLAFQASHPEFIRYFETHGLTTGEINYVCLYALGLKGKEVGAYMKKRSHVNLSSAIRKKLGLDKFDTNIGIYVRKLLNEL
ncbi:MAG: hypothetical protein K2K93_03965 [Muribaculaceae bacterium]|nr:hypothetical protein [Muribaculaceae bacterium]